MLYCCKAKDATDQSASEGSPNDYAQYFSLSRSDTLNTVVIKSPRTTDNYYKGSFPPDHTPERVVCMSTSHIAYMSALGLTGKIVGVSGGKYVSDRNIISKIASGEIADIGYEGSLNYELLIKLNPDLIFTYGIEGENNIYIEKLRNMGFQVIVLGDYLENHPLGKLEYLKLFGAVFNCSDKADSIYDSVKDRYMKLRASMAKTASRPKVLLNAPWKNVWYIPGRENYMSVLIMDAGGDPLLSKKGESGSHPYNIEDVYREALSADLWLNPNNYRSLNEIINENSIFRRLPVLKEGLVFNNTLRDTPNGGSDFWERGVIEPDVILKDLISIIHPEQSDKNYKRVYYKEL
jgi:iron complex transport system substrate-binding protein